MRITIFSFIKLSFFLFLFSIQFGCQNKTITEETIKINTFEGLYSAEYNDYDVQHVWVFSKEARYLISPGVYSNYLNPNKNLNFSAPIYYYTDNNKLYFGGRVSYLNPAPLNERKFYPAFNIISIDTLDSGLKTQVIKLEEFDTQRQVKLTKLLR